ncbi:MAG TPA: hypothetical protein VG826_11500 [Pirellulales bacterium]|nr:hypothetical protein [Pirellulales bacterium]
MDFKAKDLSEAATATGRLRLVLRFDGSTHLLNAWLLNRHSLAPQRDNKKARTSNHWPGFPFGSVVTPEPISVRSFCAQASRPNYRAVRLGGQYPSILRGRIGAMEENPYKSPRSPVKRRNDKRHKRGYPALIACLSLAGAIGLLAGITLSEVVGCLPNFPAQR